MNQYTKDLVNLKGSGFGGGKGFDRNDSETADSLFSDQTVRILDLVSEGEIGGLGAEPLKNIYLNGTPVENADGTFNFFGVKLFERTGTQTQSHISGIPSIENSVAINVEIKKAVSHSQAINDSTVDDARITVNFPSFLVTDKDTGKIRGTSVNLSIEVDVDGGGFVEVINDTISGKSSGGFSRDYKIELPVGTTRTVRVKRNTDDATSALVQNRLIWTILTEIKNEKLTYPNSAVYGLEMDSKNFSNVPVRGYLVDGLKVQIPSNYDPITRVYDPPVWDGTFVTAWTDNPAWIFFDLVTNTRYGLGSFIPVSLVNKFDLYAIGQYCDTSVDDGFGGTEPRFTCNTQIQKKQDAYKLLLQLASVFRGMPYWAGGQFTAVQDAPANPIALFNESNVEESGFSYSGSASNARHTVALVTWNNPDNIYKPEVEYVEDTAGIARYGINETEIIAIGATSRGQANRVGRWALLSELTETEIVSFTTGLEATVLFPGAIIQIQDPHRTNKDFGGRVSTGATTTSIPLDVSVTLETAKVYQLSIVHPDGTLETQPVSNAVPGSYTTLTVSPAFSAVPNAQSVWVLSSDIEILPQYRVLSVVESQGLAREVTAVAHNPDKFTAIEDGIQLTSKPIDALLGTVSKPVNIVLSEYLVDNDGELISNLAIQWDAVSSAVEYFIRYKRDNENYQSLNPVRLNYAEIPNAIKGIYTIQIVAVDGKGLSSPPAISSPFQVKGIDGLELAPNVSGLELFNQGNDTNFIGRDAKFTWRKASNLNSFDLGSEPNGADSGSLDSFFKDFEVRIYDNDTSTRKLLRTEHVIDNFYTYTWEKNVEDAKSRVAPNTSIPFRSFVIEVYQQNINNAISAFPAKLRVQNPAPQLPTEIFHTKSVYQHFIRYTPPLDHDWVGMIVWRSTISGFTPGQSNKVYKGQDTFIVLDGIPGTTYYYRFAPYDAFDETGLNISGEHTVILNFIQDFEIDPEAIIETVITDGSITTPKLAANAVTAAKILANTITANEIQANTITGSEIQANTITGSHIFAATITADKYLELRNSQLITAGDSLDIAHPFIIPFPILSEMTFIRAVRLTFQILPYRAYSQGAEAGGQSTTSAGGATVPTTSSGGAQTSTFTNIDHAHSITIPWTPNFPRMTLGMDQFQFPGQIIAFGNFNDGTQVPTGNAGGGSHAHSIGNHSHTVSIGNHTHSVGDHIHDIVYGIFEESTAPAIDVFVDNGAGFGLSIGTWMSNQLEIDITQHFSGAGFKALKFASTLRARIFAVIELKLDITA